MSSEQSRHARRKELFHEALERPTAEREAWLRDACGDDDELLRDVQEMLAVEEGTPGFLETTTPGEVLTRSVAAAIPEQLGPFRVLRLLGEGGMGAVYEAEQNRPRRLVALKVLHPGLGTPQMLRRFELEGEVLGRLQHPGIARIYEAGSTDTGRGPQPWFAMELVDGEPLTEYCARRELPLEERLELVASVADAVQHAHQRGIVHRDLKPANVLVDSAGQPKVLDFGIARDTDGDLQGATLRTDPGMVVGTLQYMSPEQASADPDAVDVRTDVYSLGVILYELVAGKPPLELGSLPIHEALRRVLEVEPESLRSTARVPVDVAVIAQTALAKDKDRRYASANGLAADLRRFLRREPIAAQPPTTLYRLRRFAARNKSLVGGVAATFIALVVGLVMVIAQRNEAREALARAEGINSFLISDVLASPSPEKLGREARVVDVLGPALLSAERTFADQPRVAAEVLDAIGSSYLELGLTAEAEPVATRALVLLGGGGTDRLSLRVRGNHVRVLIELDRVQEAITLGESVVADGIEYLGVDDPDTLEHRKLLARARWRSGAHRESIESFQDVVGDMIRVLGEEDEASLSAQSELAVSLAELGEFAEGVELLTVTLERQDRVLGDTHPNTLATRGNLAWILTMGSEWEKAEAHYNELLPALEEVYGEDHPYTALARVEASQCPLRLGRPAEGEEMIQQAIRALEARVGPDHVWTINANLQLSRAYYRMERFEDSIRLAEGVVARQRDAAPSPADLGHALSALGRAYQESGDDASAARVYREAADTYRLAFGETSEYLAQMLYNLGVVTRNAGDMEVAIASFEEGLAIDIENWGPDHGNVTSDRYNLARALMSADRPRDAVRQMRAAVKSAEAGDFARDRVLSYYELLGHALLESDETEEGERMMLEVVNGFEALDRRDDQSAQRARSALVQLYEKQGRVAEAALYRDRRR